MPARIRSRKMKQRSRISKRRLSRKNSIPYERLEARVVLSASFGFSAGVLTLDTFTAGSHDVTISQGGGSASEMLFTLASGNWSGTNGAEAMGNGTDTLTVDGSLVNQIIIVDSLAQDFDVSFAAVDMTSLGNGLILTGVNDVTQTGAVSLGSLSFTDVSSVTLDNSGNDFDSIGGSSMGAISIVDADDVTVTGITTTNDDVKLTMTTGNLVIGDDIDLGTGNLYLDVTGNVTQQAGDTITAAGLALMVDGVTTLNEANNVDTIAASNGGQTLFTDVNGATVGSIAVDGMTVTGITTTNDDVKLTMTAGNLVIGDDINLGTGDLFLDVTGNVTQQANDTISAAGLGLMVTGTTTLTEANNVDTLAADNGGSILLSNSNGITVGGVNVGVMTVTGLTTSNNDVKLTMTSGSFDIDEDISLGAGNLFLSVAGNVTQQAGDTITAAGLGLMVSGTTTLTEANDVDTLAADNGGSTLFTDADGVTVGSVAVAGMTVTGITTASNDVKLTMSAGNLNIDEDISLGTGNLFLNVAGNVTQQTGDAITAAGLGLMVSGSTDLDEETNTLNTVAANNTGQSIVHSSVATTVGSVAVAGMTVNGISAADDFELGIQGDLSITQAINVGANTLTLLAFDLTQEGTGTITSSGLRLFAGTAYLDLSNNVDTLTGRFNSDSSGLVSLYNDVDDLTISQIMTAVGVSSEHDLKFVVGNDLMVNDEMEIGDNLFLEVNGNITQAASITAAGLGLMVGGTTNLTNTNNDVGDFAAATDNTLLFTNGSSLIVDSILVDGMTVSGISTTNDDTKLTVDGLLVINEAINVGTGDLLLDVSGDVLQSEPITAAGLALMVGGKTSLQKFSNDVNIIAADNQGITLFTDIDSLTLGTVTVLDGTADQMELTGITTSSEDAKLQTGGDLAVNEAVDLGTGNLFFMVNGNLTQTAPIMADEFGMMVTGDTTLTNPLNDVNTAAAENVGTTSFVDIDGFMEGTVTVDGMTVSGFPLPEIDVEGSLLFGSVLVGISETRTYTIVNNGDAPLELSGAPVTIIGSDEFSIVSQPTGPVGVGESVTFDVQFTPTTEGLETATLSIENNSDANPFEVEIQGTGISSLVNEKFGSQPIALTTGNGFTLGSGFLQSSAGTLNASSILSPTVALPSTGVIITAEVTTTAASGGVFSNGYVVFDYVNSTNYKIAGVETVNGLWVIAQISGGNYVRLTSVADATIGQNATHNIELQLTSTGAILVTDTPGVGDVSFAGTTFLTNNVGVGTRSANSQFDCFVIDPIVVGPEINVVGNSDFGSVLVATSSTNSFTIQNTGTAPLTLGTVEITGDDGFTVVQPIGPVAAGSSVTMNITFSPTVTGLQTATVSIPNNDSDENPFTLEIQGTGTDMPVSNVLVSEDFESTPYALATNTGFSVVPAGTNSVLQSPAATRNATSTLVSPVTPISNSLQISSTAALTASTATQFSNGYIVFDYVDASNYKLAGIEAKNQLWVIAQVVSGNYSRITSVFDSTITETATYELELELTSSLATLATRSGLVDVQVSGTTFLDNNLGVGTVMASTQFDDFTVTELP